MSTALLRLLQLTSPSLPIGGYCYSEGIETLCEQGVMANSAALQAWLTHELTAGSVRLDAAVLCRTYQGQDPITWNQWLTASRESSELIAQSLQMGRSLLRLFKSLEPDWEEIEPLMAADCHGAVAFSRAAWRWNIPLEQALLGYLHSWTSNLVGAGIKLIPLGQTAGQQVLLELGAVIEAAVPEILGLEDDQLESWTWGLSLASLNHEVQYSRLFRS
jgi:urease accessory protein